MYTHLLIIRQKTGESVTAISSAYRKAVGASVCGCASTGAGGSSGKVGESFVGERRELRGREARAPWERGESTSLLCAAAASAHRRAVGRVLVLRPRKSEFQVESCEGLVRDVNDPRLDRLLYVV
jgi:hypothetical protein